MNKTLIIVLLVWTIGPCVCAATALLPSSISPSDHSQSRSPTLNARAQPICVKANQNPDWAGAIDPSDCAEAIARLWDRVHQYGYTQWKFWASVVDQLLKITVY